ncbi:hypothetical protein ACFQ88_27595 [Paenibacillus sp. NPDC056579]|uniref:hypothetical protein n=1 Tax=unclassified Paenibacillus TaxID=185978 RepID=UPI001EF7EAED|nr:hypothetical protein [Paenibacillus sp. H1-7]ULL13161.1 hypothetical protein DVH26_00905 [Paenibacillus sp. H1-7]
METENSGGKALYMDVPGEMRCLVFVNKESLVGQFKQTIAECSRNPDLPFWGEVFVLLHQMKKVPGREMPLYEIAPSGEVIYDHGKRRFIVRAPDMDIVIKDSELADAIVKQRLFWPK